LAGLSTYFLRVSPFFSGLFQLINWRAAELRARKAPCGTQGAFPKARKTAATSCRFIFAEGAFFCAASTLKREALRTGRLRWLRNANPQRQMAEMARVARLL
jgi:hypothetical protein